MIICLRGRADMECKHCGRLNGEANKYCIYCRAQLINPEDIRGKYERERYESDIGFSNPNATYVKPRVINTEEDIFPSDFYDSETSPTKRSEVQRKMTVKLLIPLIIVTVVIVSFLVLYRYVIRDNSAFSFVSKNAIEVYYDFNKNNSYVFNTEGELLFQIKNGGHPFYNKDHTAAILLYDIPHYVNADKMLPLEPNISECCLSDDGNSILYTVFEGNVSSLYLFDIEKEKKKLVDQVEGMMYGVLNILPDGKTISYAKVAIGNSSKMNTEALLMKPGEEAITIGNDILILAISDDMKYVYYCEYKNNTVGALYVKYNDKDILLSEKFLLGELLFNEDITEVLFTDGDSTYISIEGNEPRKLIDARINHLITPENSIVYNWRYSIGVIYGMDSFRNKTALFNDGVIRFIGAQYDTKDISSDTNKFANYIQLSEDGNELLYGTTDGRLIKVKDLKGAPVQETYIEHVNSFVASSDLSHIYYTDHHVLYYINDHKQIETIVTEDNITELYLSTSGDTVFFLKSVAKGKGSLYYSTRGREPHPVQGGDEVTEVMKWNDGIVYHKEVDGKTNSYYCSQGTKFRLLIEGIDVIAFNSRFY